jgi:hypothetical protein
LDQAHPKAVARGAARHKDRYPLEAGQPITSGYDLFDGDFDLLELIQTAQYL